MATSAYMTGRRKYGRPQAVLFSNNPGTLVNGLYVPNGFEIGQDPGSTIDPSVLDEFLILSDHNRSDIKVTPNRIEKRERMINGRMRSYHIADKIKISTSWNMLPSRSHEDIPNFDQATGISTNKSYTTDGGAGGADIQEWYNDHKGSFWVFLAYDRKGIFRGTESPYDHLRQYNQVIEMFISDFSFSVEKRGPNFDYWNVSVSLEEV